MNSEVMPILQIFLAAVTFFPRWDCQKDQKGTGCLDYVEGKKLFFAIQERALCL